MKRHQILPLAFFGFLALPQQASANAGTPLMWAGMIHLVIGNAIIGVIEGFLLAWLFNISWSKAIGTMIAGNYVSAWVGGLFIRGASGRASSASFGAGAFPLKRHFLRRIAPRS